MSLNLPAVRYQQASVASGVIALLSLLIVLLRRRRS